MACFADINVSQGSVATYARCGGIFNIRLTANLRRNLQVKNFVNRLRFDRIIVMSLWLRFWPTLCMLLYDACCACLYANVDLTHAHAPSF